MKILYLHENFSRFFRVPEHAYQPRWGGVVSARVRDECINVGVVLIGALISNFEVELATGEAWDAIDGCCQAGNDWDSGQKKFYASLATLLPLTSDRVKVLAFTRKMYFDVSVLVLIDLMCFDFWL